jgi:hypothetical protein
MLATWSIRSRTHQGSYHIKEHKFAMGKKEVKTSTPKNLIKKPNQKRLIKLSKENNNPKNNLIVFTLLI